MGDSRSPLYFQLGSVVLTTILDPLLIFGWLGLPKLGLNGTAWATLVSQLAVIVALVVWLRSRNTPVAPAWPRLGHLAPTIKQILQIGLPSAVQQSFISIGIAMVTGIVNGAGHTLMTTVFSLVSLWLVRIPGAYWLSRHLGSV